MSAYDKQNAALELQFAMHTIIITMYNYSNYINERFKVKTHEAKQMILKNEGRTILSYMQTRHLRRASTVRGAVYPGPLCIL